MKGLTCLPMGIAMASQLYASFIVWFKARSLLAHAWMYSSLIVFIASISFIDGLTRVFSSPSLFIIYWPIRRCKERWILYFTYFIIYRYRMLLSDPFYLFLISFRFFRCSIGRLYIITTTSLWVAHGIFIYCCESSVKPHQTKGTVGIVPVASLQKWLLQHIGCGLKLAP